jgi:hypothetical protein
MSRRLEAHAFCTSVKCAAVVYTFGGRFRRPPDGDPITHEIFSGGREEIRYHFFGNPEQGIAIANLICAYSIMTRGVPEGMTPKSEVIAVVKDETHPIHACFRALNERDRLHQLFFEAARGKSKPFAGQSISTSNTKLAAAVCSSGHKEIGVRFDGKAAHFEFEDTPEVKKLADAYDAAWAILFLPQGHPIYWMKSALDHRDEILIQKRDTIKSDGTRGVEPFYVEQRGGEEHLRITKTPVHISAANLEKSKKYLNS